MDALFEWMKAHGALFPSLEYRDGGMFCTSDLRNDALLAYIPTRLILSHTNGTNTNIADLAVKLREVALDPSDFFRPFIESLPWTCQTPHCGADPWPALNLTVTPLFNELVLKNMDNSHNTSYAIESSLAISRRWNFGLVPGMDLFNHMNEANPISATQNSRAVFLQSHKPYKKGEEVFISYGTNKGAAAWTSTYNMQHTSSIAEDNDCITQLSFYASSTLPTSVKARTDCFSKLNLTTENFDLLRQVFEKALALGDMAAIKGLAHRFSKNLSVTSSA